MINPVPASFDRVADRYDLMVALNPGYHDQLRFAADALGAGIAVVTAPRVLDLGCGSGASTAALLRALPGDAEVVGVDGSAGMLRRARAKHWPDRVSFRRGYAEDLDTADHFDAVFAGYLLRNVAAGDRDALLRRLHELLRPGGVLVLHDYSVADRTAVWIWHATCWAVVIPLGLLTSATTAVYRHLWRSVLDNDSPTALCDRVARAGFDEIRHCGGAGWQRRILRTVVARRP